MNTNKNSTFTIEETHENLVKITQQLDAHRTAITTENNLPKYIMIRYDSLYPPISSDEELNTVSKNIMEENKEVYEELSK